MPERRPRVYIYVRVSTRNQTNLNQFMALRKAAEYHGWDIVGVYRDWGFSGKTNQRPGFQRMIDHIHRRKVDMVAFWSLSRIGRSLKDLIYFTDEVLKKNSVNLFSMTEDLNTSTPAGRLFYHLLGAFAQYERESTVEKVMEGLARARAQGKTLGRPAVHYKPELIDQILEMSQENIPLKIIAKKAGCAVGTVYKILNEHAPDELNKRKISANA
jgi:hypothetical protein